MIKRGLFIFFIILNFQAFSFHSYDLIPLDTLLKELSQAQTPYDTIESYFKLSSHFVNCDIEKCEYYANEILERSLELGYKKGEADGYYSLGRIFYNSHYDISFNFIQKALSIYIKINDKFQVAKSLNLIAIIKGNLGETESALKYCDQVLDLSLEIGDSTLYSMVLNNIGSYYSDLDNDSIANDYYFQAVEVNKAINHKRFLSINYGNICITALEAGDVDTARKYWNFAEQLKKEINDQEGYGWLYETYATILKNENKMDSALLYYYKSNEVCKRFNNRRMQEVTIRNLQELHHELNNIDSAYYWLLELNTLQDSIYDNEKTKAIYLHEINLKHKQESELQHLQMQTQRFKLGLIIAFLALLVMVTLLIIYLLNQRRKNVLVDQEKAQLENENLEKELYQKKQELATHVMNMVNNNQMVHKVVDKLKLTLHTLPPKNKLVINRIIKELNSGVNKDIWKEFELRFNQVHPDFQNKLLGDYPDLTPNELKLCSFLKLNMSSKEISQITYQSIQSIEKARSRLRKKLHITNTDITFVYFLSKY